MKELLVLTPENNKPTKILNNKLVKISSFDAGWLFRFSTIQYADFHAIINDILIRNDCFIVLGELTEYGQSFEDSHTLGPRRKKKGTPTIQNKKGSEIVLDLDDHIIPGFNATNAEPAIKNWLDAKNINCDVTWQITSSQQLQTEEARIRLYFSSSKNYSLDYRKAWSQSTNIAADGSVYTCSQPIYTAPPIIQNNKKDPIKIRHGFIKGEKRKLLLPEMTQHTIQTHIKEADNKWTEHNYESNDIPQEVLQGKVYRRYFMPLAFHYANLLKSDREAIFNIIAGKAKKVKSREFDADNVYGFIDDAIEKIASENSEKDQKQQNSESELLKSEDIKNTEYGKLPVFPENVLNDWPEPWPMIWDNFIKIPREVEPALLLPTVLSLCAFCLRSNYTTAYNRRPNLFFLNLTPSTGNKDVNSKNVIRDLDIIFRNNGSPVSVFSGILNTESSITADTTFLSSFSDNGELFWINTEATRIFQQIKNSGNVAAVAALSDKLIELVDGHEITGKNKVSGKVKTIQNPNAQVLFYAQPETIERYIDEEMVDSGLFGRALLSIIPELKFNRETYSMFQAQHKKRDPIDIEFYNFFTSHNFNISNTTQEKIKLAPFNDSLQIMDEWARDKIAPIMENNDSLQKVLSRIGNSAEQLYCVILGICQLWDLHKNQKIRQSVPVQCMFPILEYWASTKVYAINNFVNTELDPLASSIEEIIKDCISEKITMVTLKDKKLIRDYHMVPVSQLMRILKNRTKLIRKLSADGDKKNAVHRALQLIQGLERGGIIQQAFILGKECVGLLK